MSDNSRYFEEKFSEGYNLRTSEINKARLILIENELYEVDPVVFIEFLRMRNDKKHDEALDYIRDNSECINNNTLCYNY